jgi:tRNA G18 (ribose-2'-O)-methylase SpoU
MIDVGLLRDAAIAESNNCFNVHDHLKTLSVEQLRELTQQNLRPFEVLCLNVMGDLNIGTIIRSSHLFGARRVHVFGRRRIDNRGLVGAQNYTKVEKTEGLLDDGVTVDPQAFWNLVERYRLLPIFVEQGGTNLYEYNWHTAHSEANSIGRSICLVMGTENSGIPRSILDDVDMVNHAVSIPQQGVIRSHNVSMAFAITAGQMIGCLGWY